jgi:hypothetical protein
VPKADVFHLMLREGKLKNKAVPVQIENIKKFLEIWPDAVSLSVNIAKDEGLPVIRTIGARAADGREAFFQADLLRTCVKNCHPYMGRGKVVGLVFVFDNGVSQYLVPETYSNIARDIISKIEFNGKKLPENFKLTGDLHEKGVPPVPKS